MYRIKFNFMILNLGFSIPKGDLQANNEGVGLDLRKKEIFFL